MKGDGGDAVLASASGLESDIVVRVGRCELGVLSAEGHAILNSSVRQNPGRSICLHVNVGEVVYV